MNNCPKCGNPLQAGVTSCPICGTNVGGVEANSSAGAPVKETVQVVQAPSTQAPTPTPIVQEQPPVSQTSPQPAAGSNNKVVSSVAAPTVAAPAPQAQVEQPVSVTPNVIPPVAENNAPVAQNPVNPAPTQAAVEPQVLSTPVAGVGPQPVVQPITPQATPITQVVGQPNIEQVIPNNTGAPITPTTITPTVEPAPVPGIPASLTGAVATQVEPQNVENTKTKEKKAKTKENSGKSKKPLFLVAGLALVVIIAVAVYMVMGTNNKLKNDLPKNDGEEIATSAVISHGFKFGLQDGWLVNEDQNNVIIMNSAETVSIRLSQSATSMTNITEEIINAQLSRNENFKDTKVTTTQIGARDAYVVNATLNETLPVQIYFISGGTSLTLGVTVIYQSAETKNKLESNIIEMIGSISYSDDSIKAISTISMYSEAFNMFNNIVTNKQPEVVEPPVEENPEEETPTTPEVNQPTEQTPVTPENPEKEPENTPVTE